MMWARTCWRRWVGRNTYLTARRRQLDSTTLARRWHASNDAVRHEPHFNRETGAFSTGFWPGTYAGKQRMKHDATVSIYGQIVQYAKTFEDAAEHATTLDEVRNLHKRLTVCRRAFDDAHEYIQLRMSVLLMLEGDHDAENK
jgi:hypothetical protein